MNGQSNFNPAMYPVPTGSAPQAGLVLVVSGGRGEVIIEARSVVDVTNTLSVGVVS